MAAKRDTTSQKPASGSDRPEMASLKVKKKKKTSRGK